MLSMAAPLSPKHFMLEVSLSCGYLHNAQTQLTQNSFRQTSIGENIAHGYKSKETVHLR